MRGMHAAALFAATAVGCAPSGAEPRLGVPARVTLKSPADVAFEMDHRKPVVAARLNGKGPYRLLVDTSAGTSVLDRTLADELGLATVRTMKVGDPADPEGIDADVVRLESIELAGAVFHGVEVLSWDRSGLYGGALAPRGVLGFPLFASGLLTMDYGASRLRYESGSLPAPDGQEILPMRVSPGGIPEIAISLAGRSLEANLDTGSTAGVGVPPALAETLPFTAEPIVVGRGRTATSEFAIRAATLDGSLRIGRHEIEAPRVILNERLTTANLGSGVLSQFVLTFDQENLRVRIRKSAPKGGPQ